MVPLEFGGKWSRFGSMARSEMEEVKRQTPEYSLSVYHGDAVWKRVG
jgi:hypothetical protein